MILILRTNYGKLLKRIPLEMMKTILRLLDFYFIGVFVLFIINFAIYNNNKKDLIPVFTIKYEIEKTKDTK
jgi:hypothetical protein